MNQPWYAYVYVHLHAVLYCHCQCVYYYFTNSYVIFNTIAGLKFHFFKSTYYIDVNKILSNSKNENRTGQIEKQDRLLLRNNHLNVTISHFQFNLLRLHASSKGKYWSFDSLPPILNLKSNSHSIFITILQHYLSICTKFLILSSILNHATIMTSREIYANNKL